MQTFEEEKIATYVRTVLKVIFGCEGYICTEESLDKIQTSMGSVNSDNFIMAMRMGDETRHKYISIHMERGNEPENLYIAFAQWDPNFKCYDYSILNNNRGLAYFEGSQIKVKADCYPDTIPTTLSDFIFNVCFAVFGEDRIMHTKMSMVKNVMALVLQAKTNALQQSLGGV